MDLYKAIRSLYDEKKRLDRLIESLDSLRASGGAVPVPDKKKRRGRKGMTPEERVKVSERMKKYWANRRSGTVAGQEIGRETSA
jgi:hypothetical protein